MKGTMIRGMKTNYHTHCSYCDGTGSPEEIVLKALDKGFDALGFSSHEPYNGEHWCLNTSEVSSYAKEIRDLAEKYRDRIRIFCGMEREFIASAEPWTPGRWQDLPLDFVIGSVHFVYSGTLGRLMGVDGPWKEMRQLIDEGYGGNARAVVEAYYDTMALMVRRESFDFVGHLDVIKKHNKRLGFLDESEPWYMEKVRSTLEEIRRRGVAVEINTGGITRNATDDFYPSLPVIRECRRLEIPILINSDSHNPEHLDGVFEEARQAVLDEGYRERLILADGGWKSIPL